MNSLKPYPDLFIKKNSLKHPGTYKKLLVGSVIEIILYRLKKLTTLYYKLSRELMNLNEIYS